MWMQRAPAPAPAPAPASPPALSLCNPYCQALVTLTPLPSPFTQLLRFKTESGANELPSIFWYQLAVEARRPRGKMLPGTASECQGNSECPALPCAHIVDAASRSNVHVSQPPSQSAALFQHGSSLTAAAWHQSRTRLGWPTPSAAPHPPAVYPS